MLKYNQLNTPKTKSFTTITHVILITILTSTPVFLPGAANDLIREDIALSVGAIGLIITLYWSGSLLGAFFSRKNNNYNSLDKKLGMTVIITAGCLFLSYFSPAIGLWVGAAVGGIVYGYSQPLTNMLIVKDCSSKIQGFAFGLKQAAVPATTLICSLSIPILALPLGWKNLFGIIALFALIYGVTTLVKSKKETNAIKQKESLSKLPLNRQLTLLALAGALGAAIGNSLGGFLITTLTYGGISLVHASIIASLASLANILVRIFAGVAIDYSKNLAKILLVSMFVIGTIGTVALTIPVHSIQILGAILAYGGGWGWAGLLHYVTGAGYPGREGQATAISQMGVSIGASTGPLIFGLVFSSMGSVTAWYLMSIAGIIAAISILGAYQVKLKTSEG